MRMTVDNCGNIIENPNSNEIALYNELVALRNRYEIMKADYENRLKADMVAMLEEIRAELNKRIQAIPNLADSSDIGVKVGYMYSLGIIQEKISSLKENKDGKHD